MPHTPNVSAPRRPTEGLPLGDMAIRTQPRHNVSPTSSLEHPAYPPDLYQPIHTSLVPQNVPHAGYAIWEIICAPAHPIFTHDRLLIVDEGSVPVQGTVEEISEIQRGVIAFKFRSSHDLQCHLLVVPVAWSRLPTSTRLKNLLTFLCLPATWPVPFNALAGEKCSGAPCIHLPTIQPIRTPPPARPPPCFLTLY
ncbi:hypothetical protein FA95DRAFT_1606371 [Auriscalpium vulgare]|uniref:Uncharacterized protein n=1 Tax=Auriscalpium vulgare TaxID=40419 RepID=A0ACB8RTF3_9AGAM|nr:hypothetical protein FA95DRAFT_1606371 [Auriscalpium vulgare]